MKSHAWVQENLYELETGTLSENNRALAEEHLARCAECSHELKELRVTLKQMPQQLYNPSSLRPEMHWQMFAQRVERKLDSASEVEASWIERFREMVLGHRMVFALGFGSALLLAGVTVGVWMTMQKNAGDDRSRFAQQELGSRHALVQTASLEERTEQYLDRSKILLVGLINTDPQVAEKSKMDFSRQVEVSRELVKESRQLVSELNDPSQQRMKRLVSDLEMILLQIATLQGEVQSPAIEIVKSGVDRRGILFKINLEEIQRAQLPKQVSKPSKQSI
jgi:hypothetical protein